MIYALGCLPDPLDHNDWTWEPKPMAGPLPAVVDLRPKIPKLYQASVGSCVVHSLTAAARYHIIRQGLLYDFEMARLQLYWDARAISNTTSSDCGVNIRDAIKAFAKNGVGHEELWPYDVTKWGVQPPAEVYDDAVQYKALQYRRVPVDVTSIKLSLAQGAPVIIGVSLYSSFFDNSVTSTGVVPMPKKGETLQGGHSMLACGYGQRPGYITCRNWWQSPDQPWGDDGDCYIPEEYIGSPIYGADYWKLELFGSEAQQKAGRAA